MLCWRQIVLLRGGGMVREKFPVGLTPGERGRLEYMVRAGKSSARVTARVRILLKTGEGWSAPKVAQALDVAESSVYPASSGVSPRTGGRCAEGPAPSPPVPQAG